MSLINDALKRASVQSKPPGPAGPAPTMAPMHPVPDRARSGPVPIVLCIVGIGALFMAGAFWLKAKGTASNPPQQLAQQQQQPAAAVETAAALSTPIGTTPGNPTVSAPQIISISTTPTTPAPAVSMPAEPGANPVQQAAATLQTIPERSAAAETPDVNPQTAAAVVKEPVAVRPQPTETARTQPAVAPAPAYQLQAIYYRMKGPTVVINGKTLKVGDTIEGAKLVSIERTWAEIEVKGARQKLTMR